KLVLNDFEVHIVASPSALQFVGQATLEGLSGKKVDSDIFERGHIMDHIHLIRWCDLVIVAPGTANYINKIAQGVGDDLLTTLFLAHDFKKPFLIAPAMNSTMYAHPLTQKSLVTLKSIGVQILETASGVLACGETGWGKLLDPDLIYQEVQKALAHSPKSEVKAPTAGKMPKVLITFGGTQEPIDGVRVLSNVSSGKTGAQITETLASLGFDVTALVAGNSVLPNANCTTKTFTDFSSLQNLMKSELENNSYDSIIHLAAVSDYSLAKIVSGDIELSRPAQEKLDSGANLKIELKQNPKIVDQIRKYSKNKNIGLWAFKLTNTQSEEKRRSAALSLLERAHCDYVVHNDLNMIRMGKRHFTVYGRKGSEFFPDIGTLASYLANSIYEQSHAKEIV
ncbi:MAG: bifunctional phosphopantothenoylcysteine decarboxylase/phosphopantothenate--cysteine ligase CoaBC, partial [Pseudobdellovibrionaceae bacterium]